MSFLLGATCIVGITFMIVFMFIGIWLFVATLKAFHHLKYKTFLLEKIYHKLDNLGNINHDSQIKSDSLNNDNIDFFDINEEENVSSLNNIKNMQ
ncbi:MULTISPECIES: hypothetical protein [Clostridium]|uniref:Uncharacterized protein n=1 Tax=Clostridium cibarium TaxID=2762247 RepID=A0ABR8PY89_9CLOT|nr:MULTISPECIES: hypothetical protein [Clostridium]MBD7913124.1 hypothetical protein [Clostridium cibarium]